MLSEPHPGSGVTMACLTELGQPPGVGSYRCSIIGVSETLPVDGRVEEMDDPGIDL